MASLVNSVTSGRVLKTAMAMEYVYLASANAIFLMKVLRVQPRVVIVGALSMVAA